MHLSLSTLAFSATAVGVIGIGVVTYSPPPRPVDNPLFAPASTTPSINLRRAEDLALNVSGTNTWRQNPPLPYITGVPSRLFKHCLEAEGNNPVDTNNDPAMLPDNLDIRRLAWPPTKPEEHIGNDTSQPLNTGVIARYESRFRRGCDTTRPRLPPPSP